MQSPKSVWVRGNDFNRLYDPDLADSCPEGRENFIQPLGSPNRDGLDKFSEKFKKQSLAKGLDLADASTGTVPLQTSTDNKLTEITSLK